MPQIHKCSPCDGVFATVEEYLTHSCPKAEGAEPTTFDYLIKTTTPLFAEISEAAIERGNSTEE